MKMLILHLYHMSMCATSRQKQRLKYIYIYTIFYFYKPNNSSRLFPETVYCEERWVGIAFVTL